MSKSQLTQYYLPLCSRLVKEAICLELKGRTACLIVDEMSKNGALQYHAIVLSRLRVYNQNWGLIRDTVSLSSQSSESFVKAINEVNEMTLQHRVSLFPSS